MSDDSEACPLADRLGRARYFGLPRSALLMMPIDWRQRLESLLCEMDAAGIRAPGYYAVRSDAEFVRPLYHANGDLASLELLAPDPWANYKDATAEDVRRLSPAFVGDHREEQASGVVNSSTNGEEK